MIAVSLPQDARSALLAVIGGVSGFVGPSQYFENVAYQLQGAVQRNHLDRIVQSGHAILQDREQAPRD